MSFTVNDWYEVLTRVHARMLGTELSRRIATRWRIDEHPLRAAEGSILLQDSGCWGGQGRTHVGKHADAACGVRRVVPRAGHALGFLGDEEPVGLEKGGEGSIGALAEMGHVKADCCRRF